VPRRHALLIGIPFALFAAWLVAALLRSGPPPARSATTSTAGFEKAPLPARPGTLAGVFAMARAGDVIELAPGDYGTFRGGFKNGRVLVRPAPGAVAKLAVAFESVANVTLQGLTITDLEIRGRGTRAITVRDSRFDRSQAVIYTKDLANADILFEHNVHEGFVKCAGCYEGRVELVDRGRRKSGVTIRDSIFRGGNSDGIQNGGDGVRILSNTFSGIHQVDGRSGVHADAIQLFGSRRTVIRGNRMEDVATGIMAPDGADHELIEDNTIGTAGYPYAITLGGDRGSVVRGNRLAPGACDYGLPCGTLRIMRSNLGLPGRDTVVEGNSLGKLAVEGGSRVTSRSNVIQG
jgi:hypothetical protein